MIKDHKKGLEEEIGAEETPEEGPFSWDVYGEQIERGMHLLARIFIPGTLLTDVRNSGENKERQEEYIRAVGGEIMKLALYGAAGYGIYLAYELLR